MIQNYNKLDSVCADMISKDMYTAHHNQNINLRNFYNVLFKISGSYEKIEGVLMPLRISQRKNMFVSTDIECQFEYLLTRR